MATQNKVKAWEAEYKVVVSTCILAGVGRAAMIVETGLWPDIQTSIIRMQRKSENLTPESVMLKQHKEDACHLAADYKVADIANDAEGAVFKCRFKIHGLPDRHK